MGLAELTQSRGWKAFMAKLYGIGAAVVIVGALFKIMHWPGAGPMLVVGLTTEALIFTFSAFEPIHEELDWTLVYPELAGLGENDEINVPKEQDKPQKKSSNVLDRFDEMLENAGMKPELFEKLSNGISNLTKTATQMSDLSEATLATQQYTKNIKAAADSVSNLATTYKQTSTTISDAANNLSNAYKQSSEALTYSIDTLSDSYNKTAQKVSDNSNKFASAYEGLVKSMNVDFSALKTGNSAYTENISALNKNLGALNAIFELQLNEADLDRMMSDLQGSVKESKKYNAEVTKLTKRLEALNTVYGNMLTAMNVNLKD
jgi:gliding motility-associated protein GldL